MSLETQTMNPVLTPEQQARVKIDELLIAAGWVLQDYATFDRQAALGVAVREFQLPSGPCDYLLFVEGKAAGVVEAKKAGVTLSAIAEQSERYMEELPPHLRSWATKLLLGYESNGEETFFRCMKDPRPRSRRTFAFHRPETLLGWLRGEKTLRAGLKAMPVLEKNGLRDCQFDAIQGLEKSLAADNPRALIQMATGAGKTFTACNFSYRLIKHAGAKRILFLVDRSNLGRQTLTEFQQFSPPGEGENFDKLYITQHLQRNNIDRNSKVVITTIQRLYSMLRGEELDEADEEASSFEVWKNADGEIPPVGYNSAIPIETFDFIITDECHRSIYGLWRQVLEYFDAHIIGLTATPSMHTLAYFNQNLVAEYPYERSVADGVNVGYEVYRIQTDVTAKGGIVDADYAVPVRDKRTRALRYKQLDENLEFSAQELDRSVTVPNQIRAVIATITPIKNGEGKEVIIGSDLANIVESNGFVINAVKSRFQTREDRQEVTGLVVNKKRNINRRFIRNVRAMLYSLKKVGSEQATLKHFLKNKSHHIPTFKSRTSIEKIIRGKIEFIRSIRGNSFSTYVTLANKFNTICKGEKPLPIPTLGQFKLYSDNVYLIINSNNLQDYTRQATAFYLNDVKGFVTCQHLSRG